SNSSFRDHPTKLTINNTPPATAPDAPTDVTATRGDKAATVSWTAAAGNGSPVTSYTITSTPDGITKTVTGDQTDAVIDGLTNGTSYTFTVVASNAAGTSPASSPSNAITPAAAPDAPTDVTATRGNTSATVTWTAAAGNGSPITSYTITSTPGGITKTVPGDTTTTTMAGLTNGTTYTFTVTATNTIGDSTASEPSNAVTPAGIPDQVDKPTATRGDKSAVVSWTKPAGNGSPLTGYTITSTPSGITKTVDGDVTTATIGGLTNGTSYTFTVVASNAAGTSPASSPSNAITPAAAPDAPTDVTATRGNTSATVTWTAAAGNGSPITSYTITSTPGGITKTVPGDTTTTTMAGLTNGTTYTFTVTATNAIGDSTASEPSNEITPAAAPDAPTDVTATRGNTAASVTWTAAAGNGSPITSYTITSTPGGITKTVPGDTTTTTMAGLTNGTTYTFTVTATNAIGDSTASEPSNEITPAAAPDAPTDVTATRGNTAASVTWTAAAGNGSPITSYTITSTPGGITKTVPGDTTTTTMAGLTNGTTYTFTVTATNAIGDSPASEASKAVTPAAEVPAVTAPEAPVNAKAKVKKRKLVVTWSAPATGGEPLGYRVTNNKGLEKTVPADKTKLVLRKVKPGKYKFRIVAENEAGTSRPAKLKLRIR
ncbi:fibronectin type III domain-containing protein, partial [uncultured Nocardioides sp.]|uniref:fibronectin type III domain-containing protein n=1 Tax=uncultured Nocardioides sp. TaxID=198441 RepID=UPI0032B2BFA0